MLDTSTLKNKAAGDDPGLCAACFNPLYWKARTPDDDGRFWEQCPRCGLKTYDPEPEPAAAVVRKGRGNG